MSGSLKSFNKKKDLLIEDRERRRMTEAKKAELILLQQGSVNYPFYLNQILDYGFLSLYLHLISMRALPRSRGSRLRLVTKFCFLSFRG